MEYSVIISKTNIPLRGETAIGRLKRLAYLFFSFLLIWILMAYVGPWGKQTDFLRPLMQFIQERDIDAGALYYTDIKEFSEAEIYMNHTMSYAPKGPSAK